MFEQHHEGTGSEYARIFRLLSAAKEEAEKLHLRNLMHLTNMPFKNGRLDMASQQAVAFQTIWRSAPAIVQEHRLEDSSAGNAYAGMER